MLLLLNGILKYFLLVVFLVCLFGFFPHRREEKVGTKRNSLQFNHLSLRLFKIILQNRQLKNLEDLRGVNKNYPYLSK